MIRPYRVPERFNYIGAFLTFRCNFKCSYCINRHGDLKKVKEMSGVDWLHGLHRLKSRSDLPITLCGGEPTLHRSYGSIAAMLKKRGHSVDILTNGSTLQHMKKIVGPHVFKREAKYASIRVSYHPDMQSPARLLGDVYELQKAGYHIGIWGLDHPEHEAWNSVMKKICEVDGIDFRLKEFLGSHNGKMYGTLKYQSPFFRRVQCRTTELLIAPDGYIYRCHADLYAATNPLAHILDESLDDKGLGEWRECDGDKVCSHCDVKVKTNRFQEYGHTSVEIR